MTIPDPQAAVIAEIREMRAEAAKLGQALVALEAQAASVPLSHVTGAPMINVAAVDGWSRSVLESHVRLICLTNATPFRMLKLASLKSFIDEQERRYEREKAELGPVGRALARANGSPIGQAVAGHGVAKPQGWNPGRVTGFPTLQ